MKDVFPKIKAGDNKSFSSGRTVAYKNMLFPSSLKKLTVNNVGLKIKKYTENLKICLNVSFIKIKKTRIYKSKNVPV